MPLERVASVLMAAAEKEFRMAELSIWVDSEDPINAGCADMMESVQIAEGIAASDELLHSAGQNYLMVISIAQEVAVPLAVNLIAAWLWDRVKERRVRSLRIDDRTVETLSFIGVEKAVGQALREGKGQGKSP
jgi:hypothetical protein